MVYAYMKLQRLCANVIRAYSKSLKSTRGLAMCSTQADKNEAEYHHAVETLNGLQTNAATLDEVRKTKTGERRSQELYKMHDFLERIGLQTEDLDRLNAIHVTGTKGKGSVCAMSERILRAHGLKTGFYSSPHLREVRERIRLNGRPLDKPKFVENFWEVYTKLKDQYGGAMPPYFRFLTVMAFNVFLKEKVDVAIIEVGIGGTFDSTNIIPNPVVCGIASLGLDHIDILGDTLEKIAWQKGGICKLGHPAFTVPQEPGPLRVLQERAEELKALSLKVVPELTDYPGEEPVLSLAGEHQKSNASLAIQLCQTWLQSIGKWSSSNLQLLSSERSLLHGVPVAQTFPLPAQFYEGLKECKWPGRNQIIKTDGVSYFIDGAHTPQSIETSAKWFEETASQEAEAIRGSVVRVLLFNITGKRKADVFLRPLLNCGFDYALFAPNISDIEGTNSADQTNLTITKDCQYEHAKNHEELWRQLIMEQSSCHSNSDLRHVEHVTDTADHVIHHVIDTDQSDDPRTRVFSCLRHAQQWCTLRQGGVANKVPHPYPHRLMEASHVQVLVTGSLHLAGAFMSVIDYNVDD